MCKLSLAKNEKKITRKKAMKSMFLSVDDSKEWQASAFAMSENKTKF